VPVGAARPELEPSANADKPRGHPQLVAGATQRADHHVIDFERLTDRARVVSTGDDAGRPHAQRVGRRQRIDQIVAQALGEIFVAGCTGEPAAPRASLRRCGGSAGDGVGAPPGASVGRDGRTPR